MLQLTLKIIVAKGKNAQPEHFLLFPKQFHLSISKNFLQNTFFICFLQALSILDSSKCHLGKGFKLSHQIL